MVSEGESPSGGSTSGEEAVSNTDFVLRYGAPSEVRADKEGTELSFVGNELRAGARARGRVKEPLRLREALSVLYAVVGSDYRYVPKDRTAYLGYLRQQQAAPKKDMWTAQKAYFEWLQRNDPTAFIILDPVVSVQPDSLNFEVFSKDESTYARLSIDLEAFELEDDLSYGTTNIDFSKAFFDGIQRMRGYRDTWLSIGSEVVGIKTEGQEVLEKKISIPDTWLRAFLQVQSAATLPKTSLKIAPIDFYNVLHHLRFHADQKRKGRGLRIELIPGEAPRLVLEPWEEVFTTSAGIYQGRSSQVIRVWGRRRLMLIRRLLPFIDDITIHLLGSGLPSFYVFKAGPLKLTMGLTGWTAHDWAQAASFDLLLPRSQEAKGELDKLLKLLSKRRFGSVTELGEELGLKDDSRLYSALQLGCQQGRLMYDIDRDVYHLRELTAEPLNWDRLEFRNDRERVAHDLLAKGAVKLESENRVSGTRLELTGKVTVAADERDYRPLLVIDVTGRVRKAECSCRFYRTNKLKQGPCSHIVALLLWHAEEEARRRELLKKGELRETTTVETKTYAKRHESGEEVYQMTLNHQRLRFRWGQRGEGLRVQNLVFNSTEEAREAYFTKVDSLESKGYLDATEGGVAD